MAVEEGCVSFASYGVTRRRIMKAGDDVGEFAETAFGSGAGPDVPLAAAGSCNPAWCFARRPDREQGRVVESLYEVENMERPAPDCKGRHKSIKLMRHGGA